MKTLKFNDYLIFADESGDHLLIPHYQEYPLFVLVFCIVKRDHYANFIVPELMRIKLKYFEDPHVVFHERDIRRTLGNFEFLTNTLMREAFLEDLNDFFVKAEFDVVASVIRKDRLQHKYNYVDNPYTIATKLCMESLLSFLNHKRQLRRAVITFEARGKKEDKDLELSFLRLINEVDCPQGQLIMKILPKISNCAGLQLADLTARPIGRYVLNPQQSNRAFDTISPKIVIIDDEVQLCGLKVFP